MENESVLGVFAKGYGSSGNRMGQKKCHLD
jgi:hypothetical protein